MNINTQNNRKLYLSFINTIIFHYHFSVNNHLFCFFIMEKNTLSQRIRNIREILGLSQNEFANKINRTSNFIAQIESGRSNISEKTKTATIQISAVLTDLYAAVFSFSAFP